MDRFSGTPGPRGPFYGKTFSFFRTTFEEKEPVSTNTIPSGNDSYKVVPQFVS